MRVLIVANINSPHTRKWALALKAKGLAVAVFSINPLSPTTEKWFAQLDASSYTEKKERWLPAKYLNAYRRLKRFISDFKPDVLHSHFLTNYTLMSCITGYKPHVATAWGSDVFLFPKQNILNKRMFVYNLRHADMLISTSHEMAAEMNRYTNRNIEVIPFGVDFSLFTFKERTRLCIPGELNIYCFKKLGHIYGQDLLLNAVAKAIRRLPGTKINLHLYGDGIYEAELKRQVESLNLKSNVVFHGWVSAEKIPALHQQADVCVYLSRRESFGVSLIEAMASGVPLIVSPIPAFREVGAGPENVFFAAGTDEVVNSLVSVVSHPEQIQVMCNNAFKHAKAKYDLDKNIQDQIDLYKRAIKDNNK